MSDIKAKKTRPRRNWPKSLKRQIVEESNAPGVSVCEVARGYDLDPAQLFSWRKKFGVSVEEPAPSNGEAAFVTVEVNDSVDLEVVDGLVERPSSERFEIAFPNGRHLFVPVGVEPALLGELIAVLGA